MTLIVEAATGRQFAEVQHPRSVVALAWSPDGQLLAYSGAGKNLQVEVNQLSSTQPQVGRLGDAPARPCCLGSGVGTHRAPLSAAYGELIDIAEAATGQRIAQVNLEKWIGALAWSGDGKYLAAAAGDTIQFMDPMGQHVMEVTCDQTIHTLGWSSDGRRLAVGTGNYDKGQTRVIDAISGQEIIKFEHNQRVRAVAWSADDRLIATASDDKVVSVMDIYRRTDRTIRTRRPGLCGILES